MSHNREYGTQDSQVKKLLQKFREKDYIQRNSEGIFPQYSAVRQPNQENVLATSEISWLDKMAEINDKVCDETIYQGREENNNTKLANSMKFSFNQNYQTQIKQEQKKNYIKNSREEGHQSLREIYMKEMEKESGKIKQVQRARKQIIQSINHKKHSVSNRHNKENLVGSIKRKNSNYQTESKSNQVTRQNKLSLGFETIQLPKNIIVQKKRQENKQQETNSLRYLQQSLAKTKKITERPMEATEKVELSKKFYLQSGSSAHIYIGNQSNITVKQFNQRQLAITQQLQIIFQKVDRCKIGKLEKQNCDYQNIQDLYKIVFGSIFARIKFKNLTLNKQQFVKIGLQMVKELHSEQFNALIETKISVHNIKVKQMQEEVKGDGFYCEKCENKISKVFSYSPEKSPTNYKEYKQYKRQTSPMKSQQTLPIADFNQQKTNHHSKTSQFKIAQLQQIQYNKYMLQKQKKTQKDLQLERQFEKIQTQRRLNKINQYSSSYLSVRRDKSEFLEMNVAQLKKKRNISESILAEHKRNLEDLVILNEQVENCLSSSRKMMISENEKARFYMEAHLNSIL